MKHSRAGRASKAWRGAAKLALATSMLASGAEIRAQALPTTGTTSSANDASDQALREIIVTGSRIRGVAPTGSNVISVGQDALAQTGAVTPQDLINQIPQNIGTGFNEGTTLSPFGTVNSTRGGAVNLRGVGPQATLVLLDGHRVAANGTSGSYIDPSSIPANAIERIEVIADGASAIYGADAVAGVVNVILRRNVNGIEASARYGLAPGGLAQGAGGLVAGHDWGSGHLMLAYEYTYRSSLNGQERDWYTSDNRSRGGTDFRASQCNPGTVQIGTTLYPIPATGASPATLVPGAANRCSQTPFNDILPSQKRHALAGYFSQDITDWLGVYAKGNAMWRSFRARFVSSGGISENSAVVIPNTNPYFILPAGVIATSETVNYSFFPQYNPIPITGFERTYNVAAGFDIKLPGSWKMNLGGVIGRNHSGTYDLAINATALTAARTSTDPATALNPFGPNSSAVLDSIFTGIFQPDGFNKIRTGELRADGPLFSLPGGSVRAAIGGEYNHISYFGGTTRGTTTAPTLVPTAASRNVKSAYAELFVPVFSAQNAIAGLQSLAFSAAVRHDQYSDVGKTTNVKFGVTWRPVHGLELRGSYGTSFRAPLLLDATTLKTGNLVSGVTRADPLAGNAQVPVVILIFGNPDIKPETARTYSFGAALEPGTIPRVRANVNYFSLDYSDQIVSELSDPTILQRASIFQSLIRKFTPALTVAQILADPVVASFLALGSTAQTLQPSQYIIDGRPYNLGRTKTNGIDFDLGYRARLGSGYINAGVTGAYFFHYKVQQTSAAPVIDQLNNQNYPLQFKSRGSLGWSSDRFDAAVYVNYANAYNNPSSTVHPHVNSYTTVDLHFGVAVPFGKSTRLSLDVTNALDRDPPFVDLDGGYDPTEANPIGRLISVSLRTKF